MLKQALLVSAAVMAFFAAAQVTTRGRVRQRIRSI